MLSSNIASESVISLPDFGVAGDTCSLVIWAIADYTDSILQHGARTLLCKFWLYYHSN